MTGFHRKHAIRVLQRPAGNNAMRAARARTYGPTDRDVLIVLWEAADRICGKRLKEAMPTFVEAMERHGHLQLEADVANDCSP